MPGKWTRARRVAHMRRISVLGGQARSAKRRAAKAPVLPYAGGFLPFLDAVGRSGPTRRAWRTFWKAADGLPLDPAEVEIFRLHTGRTTPPTTPAREVWVIAGRRGGKSENVTARATWRAISKDWTAALSVGERGILPLVAADREQARNTLAYLKGLTRHPLVAPHVLRQLKDSVEFRTGATVKVMTASWRTTRGYTMLDAVLEECAFYNSTEQSANPDEELLAAVRPALLTVPGARVTGISTPYSRRGILFAAWEKYWGRDESDVLVWVADTVSMNPSVDAAEIARAHEDDASVAGAEYGSEGLVAFRSDVEAFISREAVEAVVVPGRRELPRATGTAYAGFCDPSGGSQDAMTLAVAHRDREGRAVLDCVREIRPPFSPEQVVAEYSALLKSYGVTKVVGDRYAGEFPRELFRKCGVTYEPSERSKSEIYVEALPLINSARCELLDVPKLKLQLQGLERRTARGTGRDSVDHAPGAHDDLANAACGALVRVAGRPRGVQLVFGTGDGRRFDSWAELQDRIPAAWLPPAEVDEHGN